MNRLAVVAITAVSTLAIAAGALSLAFTIRPAMGDDGYLLLHGKEAKECEDGGGCAVMSEREFQNAVYRALLQFRNAGIAS